MFFASHSSSVWPAAFAFASTSASMAMRSAASARSSNICSCSLSSSSATLASTSLRRMTRSPNFATTGVGPSSFWAG